MDMRAKNTDLAQRLEKALLYEDKVREARSKAEEAEKAKVEVEVRAVKAEATSEQLKKELYKIECQVTALMRRIDHANEKEKIELR